MRFRLAFSQHTPVGNVIQKRIRRLNLSGASSQFAHKGMTCGTLLDSLAIEEKASGMRRIGMIDAKKGQF